MTFVRRLGSPPPSGQSRWLAAAVAFAMAFGAIGGGISLLHDAQGFGLQEAWLAGSPFSDYRVPGWFLTLVIGGGMSITAWLLLTRSRLAGIACLKLGAVLLAWLVIETTIIGFQGSQQFALLVLCGGSGLVLVVIGGTALSRAGRG